MILLEVADVGSAAEISQGEMAGGADVAVSQPAAKASKATIPADALTGFYDVRHSVIFQVLRVPSLSIELWLQIESRRRHL